MGLGKSRGKHSCQTQLPYMFTKALEKHTEICQLKGQWYASLTLLSHARNAGNHISELLNFKIFWGTMPPDPPRKGDLQPPKYSQPPTIIWADAYFKSYWKPWLRLISIAQQATKLLFSLAQDQNLHARAIGPGFFPALYLPGKVTMPTKFGALKICRCLRRYKHNDDHTKKLSNFTCTCQCFYIEFNATNKNSDNNGWQKKKAKKA